MKKEGYSNWRQDLTEVIKDQDEVGTVKEKGVKNKVEIMPKMEGYGEKTCKKCGKNPCECPKEEVTSEGMKNVMSSPDTQPVPLEDLPNARTPNSKPSKPKGPLATLNRSKKVMVSLDLPCPQVDIVSVFQIQLGKKKSQQKVKPLRKDLQHLQLKWDLLQELQSAR